MAIRIDKSPRIDPKERPAWLRLVRCLRALHAANEELGECIIALEAAGSLDSALSQLNLRSLWGGLRLLLQGQHFGAAFSVWRLVHGEYAVPGSRTALEVERDFGEEGLAMLGLKRGEGGRRAG